MPPLLNNLTGKRRAWLEMLRKSGPLSRGEASGRVGFDCMQLGWTEWIVIDEHKGDQIGWSVACDRYADPLLHIKFTQLEAITADGLAILHHEESRPS